MKMMIIIGICVNISIYLQTIKMPLKAIPWSRIIMEKVQYQNSLWLVETNRCNIVVTNDMVWKEIVVQVKQWEDWLLSLILLEDID